MLKLIKSLFNRGGSEKLNLRTIVVHGQVSTIDLYGINHFGNFFETAIYNGKEYFVVDQYPTKEAAIDGHSKWVEELTKFFRGHELCIQAFETQKPIDKNLKAE